MNLYMAAGAFAAGLETQAAVGHAVLSVEPGVTLQANLAAFAAH